jgi:predicted methyltransferase
MHFTIEAQRIATNYLSEGAIAIDATAGNGFDTLFLAETIGDAGLVYAVDIQENAIALVRTKLERAGISHRCRLRIDTHSNLNAIIDHSHRGLVSVAMFNLGYLPFGDKSIVTRSESTLSALEQVFSVIRSGGLISILAYRGHGGGSDEALGVENWIEQHAGDLKVQRFEDPNNAVSPILFALERV